MRTHRRPAFTTLELMLATLLAAVVFLAATGLFAVIQRTDARLAERFDNLGQLSRVHSAFRRAMQSLVASPRTPEDVRALYGDGASLGPFDEDGSPIRGGLADEFVEPLPFFLLGPAFPEDADLEHKHTRLEMVLTRPPLPGSPMGAGNIRGAFDFVPYEPERGRIDYALFWSPVEPPGDPILLIDNLELALWSVVTSSGQFDTFEAYTRKEFPLAMRVIIWTRGGTRIDWIFEPGVTVGEEAAEFEIPPNEGRDADNNRNREEDDA